MTLIQNFYWEGGAPLRNDFNPIFCFFFLFVVVFFFLQDTIYFRKPQVISAGFLGSLLQSNGFYHKKMSFEYPLLSFELLSISCLVLMAFLFFSFKEKA